MRVRACTAQTLGSCNCRRAEKRRRRWFSLRLHFDSSVCVRLFVPLCAAAPSARCADHVHHATQVQHRAIRGRERRTPTGMSCQRLLPALPPLLCLLSFILFFFYAHLHTHVQFSFHDRFAIGHARERIRSRRHAAPRMSRSHLAERKFKSLRLYLLCASRDVSSMLTKPCVFASRCEPLRAAATDAARPGKSARPVSSPAGLTRPWAVRRRACSMS